MIVSECVVGVRDEEGCWRLVRVLETVRGFNVGDHVVAYYVVCLRSRLSEDTMSLDSVKNIVLDKQALYIIEWDTSIVTLCDDVVLDVGVGDAAEAVVVDGISADLIGLAHICE